MKIVPLRPYHADELGIDDPDNVIWGVYVGGCIDERGAWGIWESTSGHAHSCLKDTYFGWICIIKPSDVLTPSGSPSKALLHEYAHLLCPDQDHTRSWKRAVTRLGAGSEIERTGLKPL